MSLLNSAQCNEDTPNQLKQQKVDVDGTLSALRGNVIILGIVEYYDLYIILVFKHHALVWPIKVVEVFD